MTNYYGTGVGRHLSPRKKQYSGVIFQKGKPPIAEEFNFLSSVLEEARQEILKANIASGFITDPFNPKRDYVFDPNASNMFWLGNPDRPLHAVVNGWVIPIAGTLWSQDLRSAIKLPKPDGSNPTTHFVFLEVWKAQISPDGVSNKPDEDEIYRYGNVEFGGPNLTNQILDPRFMIETSERQQIQYRIRVVENVDIERYPYGFNGSVGAQGPRENPINTQTFMNMGKELGDPGLWRAGVPNEINADGTHVGNLSPLDTVDGYVYAIPLCFVSRRRRGTWNINQQNQSVDRNPDQANRLEARLLDKVELEEDIDYDTTSFQVSLNNEETSFPSSGFLRIGNEILMYSSWTGQTVTVATDGRGARHTHATSHEEGSEIRWVSGHPLNLFADQIVPEDVLDLRHVTNLAGLSYQDLLRHNFHKLISGTLQSSWKVSEGHVTGSRHYQADQFSVNSSGSGILHRDRPDNFRKIFSDAAARQPENLVIVNSGGGVSSYEFNLPGIEIFKDSGVSRWDAGDSIEIPLEPLRGTFGSVDNKKVRFVHPLEYSDTEEHYPVIIWDKQSSSDLPLKRVSSSFTVLGKSPMGVAPSFLGGSQFDLEFSSDQVVIKNQAGNPIDFSGVIEDLLEQEAWLYIKKEADTSQIGGAYKIIGEDNGSLVVSTHEGDSPGFPNDEVARDWQILLETCSEEDPSMVIVLQEDLDSEEDLYISYDILYHPGQGLTRVPEKGLFARLEPRGEGYVRENTFADLSSVREGNLKDYGLAPMETYPSNRKQTFVRNNKDARTNVETTWAEAYLDRGSKTFLFQPLQKATFTALESANPTLDYEAGPGSVEYGFQLAPGNRSLLVPNTVLPSCGRIDAPFVKKFNNTEHPYGLNLCFQARENEQILHPHVVGLYDPDPSETDPVTFPYGSVRNLDGNFASPALVCRLYDKGGVRGLELPPHFGIARLYGLYEKHDYLNAGPMFGGDRMTPVQGTSARNLLRTDVMARSLVITPENTFVIPEDIIDIGHLGTDLSETQLIFEFTGFMFEQWTEEWIRIHTRSVGSNTLQMLMNGPARSGDVITVLSTRIPYQGNFAGTMPLSTSDPAHLGLKDYLPKRGPNKKSDIDDINLPLNARTVRLQNPVVLEIKASIPFVSTLGTGSISGAFRHGAYTDVGYISQKGFPSDIGPNRRVKTRALSSNIGPLPDTFTGLSERLPLGALVSDHLFLGEGLGSGLRRFWEGSGTGGGTGSGYYSHYQDNNPLSNFYGTKEIIFSDGTSGGTSLGGLPSFDEGQDLFRTYRGGTLAMNHGLDGGGAFLIGGERVYKDFPEVQNFSVVYQELVLEKIELWQEKESGVISSSEYDKALGQWELKEKRLREKYTRLMQIHGAVLFGIAMLVRTQEEVVAVTETNEQGITINHGGELQMLVATGTSFGTDAEIEPGTAETLDLLIQMHPTGIGEGWGAADRYRLEGRPLVTSGQRQKEMSEIHRGTKPLGTLSNNGCGCP